MKFDWRPPIVRIPQNMSAREAAQALLGLPVPRKFDIARLRPETLPRGERFETAADARARRDAELERFEQISGLQEVADRLIRCEKKSRCAEVNCPICARAFRRWADRSGVAARTRPRP